MKKFNQARVNSESNYDSLSSVGPRRCWSAGSNPIMVLPGPDGPYMRLVWLRPGLGRAPDNMVHGPCNVVNTSVLSAPGRSPLGRLPSKLLSTLSICHMGGEDLRCASRASCTCPQAICCPCWLMSHMGLVGAVSERSVCTAAGPSSVPAMEYGRRPEDPRPACAPSPS